MPSEEWPYDIPPPGWRMRVLEENMANIAREFHRYRREDHEWKVEQEHRLTAVEVRVALAGAIGGIIGAALASFIVLTLGHS